MADTGALVLEGEAAVARAITKVKTFSVEKAEARVVVGLMPEVKARTRVRYGVLQAAWTPSGSYFTNSMPYSVAQEFGTVYVEPTLAIFGAGEEAPQVIKDAFSLEIMSEARQAGFDT